MRFLLILAGAVAAAFVVAAALLTVMVDPNKYTGDIAALVKEKTGRELVIEGGVKLTFLPWLGLETGAVTLGQSPLFPDPEGRPFARVRAAAVRIRLLPLISRRVEVGKVALEGLELNLGRDEAGRANWSDLTGPESPRQAGKGEDKPSDPAGDAMSALAGLALDGVRVAGASLAWTDRQAGRRYALTDGDLTLPAVRPGVPFDFSAAFSASSSDPQAQARVELTGKATLNISGSRHLFTGLAAKVSAQGPGVPGGKGEYALALSELKLDNAQRTAQGSGLSLSAYGARVTGQFLATGLGQQGGAEYKGRLDVPDFNGRELSAALTGKAPDTADAGAYEHITAQLEFKAGRGYLEIPILSARLDDATVEGRFRRSGFENTSYSFNLRVQGLDADRFLPPAKKEPEGVQKYGAASAQGQQDKKDEIFPLESLRTMRLDGQISAERVKVRGLRLQSLALPMSVQNGVLDMGAISARLYDGTLAASLRVDAGSPAAPREPQATLNLTATGLQGRPLVSDLKGSDTEFAGLLTLDTPMTLQAQGNTSQALKRSLNGRVRFSVRDGVFPGVNLTSVVHEGAKKAKKAVGEPSPDGASRSTRFGSIDGTAVITGGVAAINDLELKAPFLRGEGKGTVSLPSKEVDYTLRVRVVPNADGQGGGGALDLLGLVVPLRITGPYDNPSYSTDYLAEIGRTALDTAKAAGRAVGGVVGGVVGGAAGVVKGLGNALTGSKKRVQ